MKKLHRLPTLFSVITGVINLHTYSVHSFIWNRASKAAKHWLVVSKGFKRPLIPVAYYVPAHTTADNKGQLHWRHFVPHIRPLQVAVSLINGSRHEDSARHLTMIRTEYHQMQVGPAYSTPATHRCMHETNLSLPPTTFSDMDWNSPSTQSNLMKYFTANKTADFLWKLHKLKSYLVW